MQVTKNVAYCWRQIVFLVSTMDEEHAQLFFKKTVSKEQAAAGCRLQRELIDLGWFWNSVHQQNENGDTGTRPWRPFCGWIVSGYHPIWDTAWCNRVSKMTRQRYR